VDLGGRVSRKLTQVAALRNTGLIPALERDADDRRHTVRLLREVGAGKGNVLVIQGKMRVQYRKPLSNGHHGLGLRIEVKDNDREAVVGRPDVNEAAAIVRPVRVKLSRAGRILAILPITGFGIEYPDISNCSFTRCRPNTHDPATARTPSATGFCKVVCGSQWDCFTGFEVADEQSTLLASRGQFTYLSRSKPSALDFSNK